ncbi:unnamed protein product [Amoebophrya sp. A25]|nr:unnamed protein product [Amoebophrya sp. A25]|eukprot:GSA25T00009093001.1
MSPRGGGDHLGQRAGSASGSEGREFPSMYSTAIEQHYLESSSVNAGGRVRHQLVRGPRPGEDIPEPQVTLAFVDVLEALHKGRSEARIMELFAEKDYLYRQVSGEENYMEDLSEVACRSTDSNGWTLLHWCVQNDYFHVACALLKLEMRSNCMLEESYQEIGGQRGAQDRHGLTPVMLACYTGARRMLDLLVKGNEAEEVPPPEHYNFLHLRNNYEATCLHYCAMRDRAKMIELIVHLEPLLLNAEDRNGDTPLHHACIHMFPTSILLLLELGADANARNNISRLPLDLVIASDRPDPRVLRALHDYHDRNLPQLLTPAEVRHEVSRLCRDETTRRFVKRQLVKKEQQMLEGGSPGSGQERAMQHMHGRSIEGSHRTANETTDTTSQQHYRNNYNNSSHGRNVGGNHYIGGGGRGNEDTIVLSTQHPTLEFARQPGQQEDLEGYGASFLHPTTLGNTFISEEYQSGAPRGSESLLTKEGGGVSKSFRSSTQATQVMTQTGDQGQDEDGVAHY